MTAHTVSSLIETVFEQFEAHDLSYGHGTDNAWDEAVALVLGVAGEADDRSVLERTVSPEHIQRCLQLCHQRVESRLPLAYLTGRCSYMGIDFAIAPGVIVPRSPIGYLLADHLLAWLPDPVTQILDLCSGSGCLGIIAAQLFPQAQVTLVELDDHAIAIARENIHRLGLDNRVTLRKGDVTKTLSFPQRFDLVLSNPPYVDAADMNQLPPEYLAEPHAGLAAGQDGLSIICPIINQLTNWLTPQGLFIGEVGASAPALMARYPRLPLFWPELPLGGEGVFLLEASGLTFHTGTTVEDAH